MPEVPKEKLEFLKREEIRTMSKDIARLREKEAQLERERIAKLKSAEEAKKEREMIERIRKKAREIKEKKEEEKRKRKEIEEKRKREEEKREQFLEKIAGAPRKKEEIPKIKKKIEKPSGGFEKPVKEKKFLKVLSERPSFWKKVFVRAVITVILLLIFSDFFLLCYWYFKTRTAESLPPIFPSEEPAPPSEEEKVPPAQEIPEEETISEELEIVIPSSLISAKTTRTLKILTAEEIPALLSQTLKEEPENGEFCRIVIEDTKEGKIIGLKQFFEIFQINPPADLYKKLNDDFTLFTYAAEKRSRLGFVAQIIEKQGLEELSRTWERTMKEDFEKFSLLLKKEKIIISPEFEEKSYKEGTFRCLIFSTSPDYSGICYGILGDFFVYIIML